MKNKIRVAGICGSLRPGSYTRMALAVALRGAADAGADTQLIDLNEYRLPFCDGGDTVPDDVLRLRADVQGAQGVILATPEYHGGYSGVLKNALDWMGFTEVEGKMIGLIGVSGGALGGFAALNSLREVGRALHAWVVPEQASVPAAYQVFDPAGNCQNVDIAKRLHGVGRQVAKFASLHNSAAYREFFQLWEAARDNPGGEDR